MGANVLKIWSLAWLLMAVTGCGVPQNSIEAQTAREAAAANCDAKGKCVKDPSGLVLYNSDLVTENFVLKRPDQNPTLLTRIMNLIDEPKLLVTADKLEPLMRGVAIVGESEPCDSPKGIDGSNPTVGQLRSLKQGRYKACITYIGQGLFKRAYALVPIDVDTTPPEVSKTGVHNPAVTPTTASLSWSKAGDNLTLDDKLIYSFYTSKTKELNSLEAALTYGRLAPDLLVGGTSYTISSLSENTDYQAAVVVTDEAGNQSLVGNSNFRTTAADANPPTSPSVVINSNASHTSTSAANLTLSAGEASEMYVTNTEGCTSGGTWEPYDTSKAWTLAQTNATATVYAKFRDLAGNETACMSDTIVHDDIAPTAPNVTGATSTNDTTPSWSWTSGGGGNGTYRYKLNNADLTAGATETTGATFTASPALSEGTHTLYVQERDAAGNWSESGSHAVVIDTTAPALTINDASANLVTPVNQASYSGVTGTCSTTDGSVTVSFTKTPSAPVTLTAACSAGSWSAGAANLSPFTDGTVTITATQTDAATNSTSVSTTTTKDTTAPNAPVVSGVTPTSSTTPTWIWTSGGGGNGTYRYKLNSSDLTTGATETTSATFTPSPDLSEGAHTLYVQERDAAGNWSESGAYAIRVVMPPAPPTLSTPARYVTSLGLSWENVVGATSYILYWSTSEGVTTSSSKISNVDSVYTHSSLTGGANYYYRLAAVRSGVEGALSNEVSAAPYTNAAPTLTAISPNSGTLEGGTLVTIAGTGFVQGTTVTIGGVNATGVTFISPTSLTATTPAGSVGAQDVVVANPDSQTGALAGGYTYTVPETRKLLLGGYFTGTDPDLAFVSGVARLNSNGASDSGFNVGSGFNNTVQSTVVQSDGKILVGGNFTSYSGTGIKYIARLNSDGTLDGGFSVGSGFNSLVRSIAVQSDGKILVGGNFTSYNGTGINYIARLNSDGALDSTFSLGSGFDSHVNRIAVQSDGKILVGGNFTTYSGTGRNYIARLNSNGTLDDGFTIGTGLDYYAQTIAVQSDGKILVAGGFSGYNGTSRTGIARLNIDGTLDNGFIVGTGFSATVYSVVVQNDGKILVGGAFSSYNGTSMNCIARLNSDGTVDSGFTVGAGFNVNLNSIALQSDGKILAGGGFTSYNGISMNRVARLKSDGTLGGGFSVGTGFSSAVNSMVFQNDGKILVGGDFTSYNGTSINRIARLNSDGSLDGGFSVGAGFNSTVQSIVVQSDGKILVGGSFTSYNGTGRNYIARLNSDGTLDSGFSIGTGFNGQVNTIVVQSDGKILIGGGFTSYNGTSRKFIARLNIDGSWDSEFTLGTGFSSWVYSIIVQSDGKILVGGSFTSYNGTGRNYMARLNSDGALDSGFSVGTGFSSTVNSLVVQSDGKILVGGGFTSYNGTSASRIARINSDGSLDSDFTVGTGFSSTVYRIVVQNDGKILVGGSFTRYNGTSRNYIARLNGDGGLDSGFDFDTNGQVITIVLGN